MTGQFLRKNAPIWTENVISPNVNLHFNFRLGLFGSSGCILHDNGFGVAKMDKRGRLNPCK